MSNRELILQGMDPMLVRIQEIKDIEEIGFKDLTQSSLGDKVTVLPSLFVAYDGGKYLDLCSKDKYFDVFVRKVFQVYNNEKGRVIVDPVFDPFGRKKNLKIDERTKAILESGDLTKVNEIYGFYDGKKSYSNSLLFQSDTLELLLPLIKYHLKKIFDYTDRVVTFDGQMFNGFRNNYGLEFEVDGLDDMLLINFLNEDGNSALLRIRSRDKNFKPLIMTIEFNDNDITVNTVSDEYGLFASNCYSVKNDNTLENIYRITKCGEPVIYERTMLESVENPLPNVSAIDSNDDGTIWYPLPWGAFYGAVNRVEKLSEVDEIVMAHNKYLGITKEEFNLREFASKEYRRKMTFEAKANRVVMDKVSKRVYGILLDSKEGIYVLETYFGNVMRTSGYYDTYLDDKYFYHITQSKEGLKSLSKDRLVTISQDDKIIKGADLLVVDDLKKKLGRN